MIRISLTSWCADNKDKVLVSARGIVGHLTKEQYEQAERWLRKLAEWTDENRRTEIEVR